MKINGYTLVNLTGKSLVLLDGSTLPPSGSVARVFPRYEDRSPDAGVYRCKFSDPQLPEETPGVLLVVTLPILLLCSERRDLVIPAAYHNSTVFDEETRWFSVPGVTTPHPILPVWTEDKP